MTEQSHHDALQEIYQANFAHHELESIVKDKQTQAWDCHQNGAYGSAREQMLIASLARQLLEKKSPLSPQEWLNSLPPDDPRVQDLRGLYAWLDSLQDLTTPSVKDVPIHQDDHRFNEPTLSTEELLEVLRAMDSARRNAKRGVARMSLTPMQIAHFEWMDSVLAADVDAGGLDDPPEVLNRALAYLTRIIADIIAREGDG